MIKQTYRTSTSYASSAIRDTKDYFIRGAFCVRSYVFSAILKLLLDGWSDWLNILHVVTNLRSEHQLV